MHSSDNTDFQTSSPSGAEKSKTSVGEQAGKKSFMARTPFGRAASRYSKQNQMRRDYEFMPATIEVLDRPPAPFSRVMLLFIIIFTAFVIGWASFAKMDILVNATGVVIPKGKIKVVQPLESGIVTAIHVRDGQIVKKGDSLITMDKTDNMADLNALKKELTTSELVILRLKAQLQDDATVFVPAPGADERNVQLHRRILERSFRALEERLSTLDIEVQRCTAERESILSNGRRLTDMLPLSMKLYDKKSALAQRKLIPNAEFLQAQIELNDVQHNLLTSKSSLQEVEARLEKAKEERELVETEYRRDLLSQLAQAQTRVDTLSQQLTKAENKQENLELKAPADGIVQQLAINTVGGVVTTAQPLLVIVPTDGGLEIEAKVMNKDIGFISQDQKVSVKVTAYPFTRYGDLDGTIEWIAGDAVIENELGPIYPIRVAVNSYNLPHVINGRQGVITPGMTVTADVKVGRRRVIQYFLGPIMRYRDQSLREI